MTFRGPKAGKLPHVPNKPGVNAPGIGGRGGGIPHGCPRPKPSQPRLEDQLYQGVGETLEADCREGRQASWQPPKCPRCPKVPLRPRPYGSYGSLGTEMSEQKKAMERDLMPSSVSDLDCSLQLCPIWVLDRRSNKTDQQEKQRPNSEWKIQKSRKENKIRSREKKWKWQKVRKMTTRGQSRLTVTARIKMPKKEERKMP